MRLTKEQHQNWQGAAAGYEAKHKYIRKHLGKATYCILSPLHTGRRYEWANLDHKYSRDLTDYIQLCHSCHRQYDLGQLIIYGLTLSDRGGAVLVLTNKGYESTAPMRNLKQ